MTNGPGAAHPQGRAGVRGRPVLPLALALCFVVSITGLCAAVSVPDATAATSTPAADMTLQDQSAWNSPARPLVLKVHVTNTGTVPLTGLALTLTIGFPARSRTVYEESLTSDPTGQLFTTTFAEPGAVAPGVTRSFQIHQPLEGVSGLTGDWVLFPLRIELRTEDQLLATIRTPMVFLSTPPTVPLNLAWTFVLSTPVRVGPDGVFVPGPIEADIAPGGRIDRIVAALSRPDPPSADLAVSPVLLAELATMADGYRIVRPGGTVETVRAGTGSAADATRIMSAIANLAGHPSIELTAMPFGDALLPAIQRSGLGNLETLIARGRTDVHAALSAFPSTAVFRPPASAIDAKSFTQVVDGGVQALLVDANFIPTPPHLEFSPSAVAQVAVGRRTARVVLPDATLAALLAAYPGDPVLTAHAALGEMAATWLEFPGTPGRGVAIAVPEVSATPASVFPALVGLVTASPWLAPERASAFIEQVPPPQGQVERLPAHRQLVFAPSYLQRLTAAQDALRQFRRAATGPDAVAEQATLASDLMTAEAGTFVAEPALGLRYIDAVSGPRGTIERTYATVQPPLDGTTFTLASRSGLLPLKFTNGSQFVLHTRIALDSDPAGGLVFSSDRLDQVQTLPPLSTTEIRFQASAATTGRYLLRVRVLTPGGATIAESQVVVRATAYNLVALVITVGAGLFLAVWWGRGFLQRRRS